MVSGGTVKGVFLVLGPPRAQWPEPLGQMIRKGQVEMVIVGGMHEVAARVAGGDASIRGVLMDPRVVMLRDLEGVRTLARFVHVPVVMLPLLAGASPRAGEASEYGVLRWEEAAPALAALLTAGRETAVADNLPRDAAPPTVVVTDNRGASNTGAEAEKSVTSQAANRYDELGIQPVVTAQELAALLGSE